MNLIEDKQSIWLIDSVDRIGIQKINQLPSIDPLLQVGKICVAMGMDKIRFRSARITIRGIEMIGCMVSCNGYDIVPFVSGIYPDRDLSKGEFDLESVYSSFGDDDDDKTYH